MKYILSIDGGGIRGLIAARICKRIEEMVEQPLHDVFDLIAGTSTGGIIALGLTRPPKPLLASEIENFYLNEGPKIFANPSSRLAYFRGPKYGNSALMTALEASFGATMIADALTEVLVPAYDLEMRQLVLFTKRLAQSPENNYRMFDVALGTSAAPTYFAPVELTNKTRRDTGQKSKILIDGGLAANSPATLAIAEAKKLWPLDDHHLVSIGTGRLVDRITHLTASKWGKISWVEPVIDCVFDGTAQATEYFLKSTVASDRYWRFHPPLREQTSAMDDASEEALHTMLMDVDKYLDQEDNRLDQLKSVLRVPKQSRSSNTHNLTVEQLNLIVQKVCAFNIPGDAAAHLRGIKILEAALEEHNYGIDDSLINALMRELLDQGQVTAMHAVDVLGPSGWRSPITYKYLALQVRHYVMKNLSGDSWTICLSKTLASAISRCLKGAHALGFSESATKFDNSELLNWKIGKPRLQYSRTLLWTREELLTPAGRAVIDIHNAFHIPLFFLETAEEDKERDLDFIYLAGDSGTINGFYGQRHDDYKTEKLAEKGRIPGHRSMAEQYETLLASTKLMFAADAYLAFQNRPI